MGRRGKSISDHGAAPFIVRAPAHARGSNFERRKKNHDVLGKNRRKR